jgi:hypothetical protein
MKAMTRAAKGGLEQLKLVDLPDPGQPKAGEIRVRLHASSPFATRLLTQNARAGRLGCAARPQFRRFGGTRLAPVPGGRSPRVSAGDMGERGNAH